MSANEISLPLTGLRVMDLSDGKGEMCGRYLAELGAEVILVEPPNGAASRHAEPMVGGRSLYFAAYNCNKKGITLDLTQNADRERFLELVAGADLLIETTRPGTLATLGLDAASLRQKHPELIVLSITDFGQTGPYRDFVATNSVHMAMGGVLCRSGLAGHPPLLPPGAFAYQTTAAQAAWCALVAYWQRLQTGVGDHLDFSVFEATAQILDPGLGVTGSAAGGQSAVELTSWGRPPKGFLYPIFPCADGFVRICILNPRQWEGMSNWLGKDHEFTDPSYGNMRKRFSFIDRVNALIAGLFHDKSRLLLVVEGQKRGIPIAAVSSPGEVLQDEHFLARNVFAPLEVAPGLKGVLPAGLVEIDGQGVRLRSPAPALGQDNETVRPRPRLAVPAPAFPGMTTRRPLDGLRVLDLGVIVAGAELGRLLGDQGAEVIKIESRSYSDGLRQSSQGNFPMTKSFAQGSRNKKSLGLNLRHEKGIAFFKQLVAQSDVILSNFKPGTMDSLGLGYDVLSRINPGIIMVDSSALGNSGPRSKSMGYGPLVRANSGVTRLWAYPEIENSFSDSVTVLPDHFAARVAATAIMAQLLRRKQTGRGGTVSVSQAEIIIATLSDQYLRESICPGSFVPLGNVAEFNAPDSVFPCAGDDEWCVVSVRNDDDWRRLCAVIERPDLAADSRYAQTTGRLAHRSEVDAALTDWTRQHTAVEVMTCLQGAGVPAGRMQRLDEYDTDPHFTARRFIRFFDQPGLEGVQPTENGPTTALNLPEPAIAPAPFQNQHTRELSARLLGLSEGEIDSLVSEGVLELMGS